MKKYMITLTVPNEDQVSFNNTIQERLGDLFRENILQQMFMSVDKSTLWLHIRAEDLFSAKGVASSIPYCVLLDKSVSELV